LKLSKSGPFLITVKVGKITQEENTGMSANDETACRPTSLTCTVAATHIQ